MLHHSAVSHLLLTLLLSYHVTAVMEKSSNNKFIIIGVLFGGTCCSLEGVLDLTHWLSNIILVTHLSKHSHKFSDSTEVFLRNAFSRKCVFFLLNSFGLGRLLRLSFLDRCLFNDRRFDNNLSLSFGGSRSRLDDLLNRFLGTLSRGRRLNNFLRSFRSRALLSRSGLFGTWLCNSDSDYWGCSLL